MANLNNVPDQQKHQFINYFKSNILAPALTSLSKLEVS